MISVKIVGEKNVIRNMNSYGRYMDIEVQNAIEEVIEVIVAKAQSLAPVDTGKLRTSIQGVVRKMASDVITGYVEATVPYASYVELGTVNQKAQPFLEPALAEGAELMNRKLKEAHERAARRLK